MRIEPRVIGDVTILGLEGKLVSVDDCGKLYRESQSLLGSNVKKVLVDMASCEGVGTFGLKTLAQIEANFRENNAQMRLVRIRDDFRDLLVITTLRSLFQIYDDEPSALASWTH